MVNHQHDKIFRTVLDRKSDAIVLINKALNTQLEVQDIEKYNSSFINKVKITKEEDKDTLRRTISIILEEKIGITKAKELIEKMEGDEGNMLAVVDMIRRENQMYIEIGKKEGELKEKIKIVTNMLKEKFNIETIQKITGINKEEIEKIAQNNNDN